VFERIALFAATPRHLDDPLRRWRDFACLVPGRAPAASILTLVPKR
jgi:hypothetical protein